MHGVACLLLKLISNIRLQEILFYYHCITSTCFIMFCLWLSHQLHPLFPLPYCLTAVVRTQPSPCHLIVLHHLTPSLLWASLSLAHIMMLWYSMLSLLFTECMKWTGMAYTPYAHLSLTAWRILNHESM